MVLSSLSSLPKSVIGRVGAPLLAVASFVGQAGAEDAKPTVTQSAPVVVADARTEVAAKREQAAETRREGASQLAVDPKSTAKDSARTIPVPPEPAPAEAVANKVKTPVTPRVNIPKFDPAKVPEGLAGLRYLREQFKLRTDAVIAETEARGRAEAAEHRENARLANERADKAGKEADKAGKEADQAGKEADKAGKEADKAGKEADQHLANVAKLDQQSIEAAKNLAASRAKAAEAHDRAKALLESLKTRKTAALQK